MKLVLAIVSNDDASNVSTALTNENYQMTRLATTGGFLRAGNTTLIVGTEDDKVERCIEIIGSESQRRTEIVPSTAGYDNGRFASFPVEVQVGGATVFVLDVEQFRKLGFKNPIIISPNGVNVSDKSLVISRQPLVRD